MGGGLEAPNTHGLSVGASRSSRYVCAYAPLSPSKSKMGSSSYSAIEREAPVVARCAAVTAVTSGALPPPCSPYDPLLPSIGWSLTCSSKAGVSSIAMLSERSKSTLPPSRPVRPSAHTMTSPTQGPPSAHAERSIRDMDGRAKSAAATASAPSLPISTFPRSETRSTCASVSASASSSSRANAAAEAELTPAQYMSSARKDPCRSKRATAAHDSTSASAQSASERARASPRVTTRSARAETAAGVSGADRRSRSTRRRPGHAAMRRIALEKETPPSVDRAGVGSSNAPQTSLSPMWRTRRDTAWRSSAVWSEASAKKEGPRLHPSSLSSSRFAALSKSAATDRAGTTLPRVGFPAKSPAFTPPARSAADNAFADAHDATSQPTSGLCDRRRERPVDGGNARHTRSKPAAPMQLSPRSSAWSDGR
eukprot:Opistho-1_new@36266